MKLTLHTGDSSLIRGVRHTLRNVHQRFETEKEMIQKAIAIYKETEVRDVEIFCNLNIVYDALRLEHVKACGSKLNDFVDFRVHLYEVGKPVCYIKIDARGCEDKPVSVFTDSLNLVQNLILTNGAISKSKQHQQT